MKVKSLSRVQLFATPRIAAHQAPLPMGFSRQEYWSGVPLPSPDETYLKRISEMKDIKKTLKNKENPKIIWERKSNVIKKLRGNED